MTATDALTILPDWTFTTGIEGPAVDREGRLYAVNYAREGTIGVLRPDGTHELFVTLPDGSTGNGIRFGPRWTRRNPAWPVSHSISAT